MLPVQLTDDRVVTVDADSSLTAAEVCRHIATDIVLRDQFGFAIYISIYDKVHPHLTSPTQSVEKELHSALALNGLYVLLLF